MRKTLELLIKGKDEASGVLKGVGSAVTKLGSVAGTVATVGLAAAAVGVATLGAAAVAAAIEITELTLAAAEVEGTVNTFENLTESLGGSKAALVELKKATRGMVSETVLMQGTNKFLAMGLADTVEEAANMAEMATQLGLAMGEEAGPSMENFALMLANQSIPRLDSFAISSGEAREMINAMMEADKSLTREQAFTNVVLELGAAAMKKVGEQGDNAAAGALRWKASLADLKLHIGQKFLPVLEILQGSFQSIIDEYGPKLVEWAGEIADWLGDKVPVAAQIFADLLDGDFTNAFLNIGALIEDTFGTETAIKFANFGKWLDEKLPIAAEVLSDFVTTTLLPAVGDFKDWCDEFADDAAPSVIIASETLRDGWEDITDTINRRLKPAWDRLNISLGTTDTSLGDVFGWLIEAKTQQWVDTVTLAVNLLAGAVELLGAHARGIKSDLDWLATALRNVRDWADRVVTALSNIHVPQEFIGASPSPFEVSLMGIAGGLMAVASAANAASGAIGTISGGGGSGGGVGIPGGGMSFAGGGGAIGAGDACGPNVYITNHFGANSVRTAQDIEDIANAIQRSFTLRGIRGVC